MLDSVHIGTSDDPKDLDSEKLPFPRNHREPKQVVASSKKTVHRDLNAVHSSVRGNSPVESNRSCKSQGSFDVYLPIMNGKFFIRQGYLNYPLLLISFG